MNELNLTNESFALVGQQDKTPRCIGCGMTAFLICGLCEPCINQHAQDLIEQEAQQRAFFQDV